MSWKDSFLAGITVLCCSVPFTLAPAAAQQSPRRVGLKPNQISIGDSASRPLVQPIPHQREWLPLGYPFLPESRESTQLAPGLTHTVIVRGMRSDRDGYAVDIAVLATRKAAKTLVQELISKGYQPLVELID